MLRLEPRREPSRAMFYLTPFLAVVLTLLAGIVLFEILRKPPLEAMRLIFIQPLTSVRGLAELLVKGTPLILIAIGLAVGFRGGIWNIGAEGQFAIGALAGGAVALAFYPATGWWLLPLMSLAGIAGGAAWAAIPALLRTRFNANEILVSLMHFLGFKIKVLGQAPRAARFGGFSDRQLIWFCFLVSGGCAGLAGLFEAAGPVGQLVPALPAGYGFTAIIVAFLGRLHPVGILFAGLLLALTYIGGETAQISMSLPSATTAVFQGMFLFFLLATDVLVNYRPRWVSRRASAPAPLKSAQPPIPKPAPAHSLEH
jgi:ABC-type uncharacterized transport system permease subunit